MGSVTGSWKPTAALLDWGFANADRVTPVGRLVDPGEASSPSPAPTLPTLPTDGATGTGTTGPGTAGALGATGTPAPVATAETTSADRTSSLVVLAGAGVVITTAVGVLALVLRRRSRA
jgi:D-alanyl-D-alanine carboxypeptidase (penicillin-binding protein 5/6)